MPDLIAACLFFLFLHFGVSGTKLRDVLLVRAGPALYQAAFALASLAGLAWIIYAYRRAPTILLWGFLLAFRPAAYVLVLIAFLFVVIGVTAPSPTNVGMESKLAQGTHSVRGMTRITRHPFLWGVALWALVHLIINGFVAGVLLFGTMLLLALGGTVSIDAKRQRNFGQHWASFAAVTSNVPFAAIISGRNRIGPALAEIGLWKPLAACLLYGLAFYLHGKAGPSLL